MTMDDDQVDVIYSRKQREAFVSMLPWVAADPGANEQCEAIKSDAPVKARWDPKTRERLPDDHPLRAKHRCPLSAKWVYVDLYGNVHRYCWHHLSYYGLSGSMAEMDRYDKWSAKNTAVIDAIMEANA